MSKSRFLLTVGLRSEGKRETTWMVRGKLPGCKGGNLAGSNWKITLVIIGIDIAKNQGINIAD